MNRIDISFFVPCFNEEGNIESTLNTIIASVGKLNYEILVVDDGSKDATLEIIKNWKKKNSNINVKLISDGVNKGLGYRYFEVAKVALGDNYMLINGDNVEPTEQIVAILEHLNKYEIVIPYYANDPRIKLRKLISKTFTLILNLISGLSIQYYNGAVLHKTEAVRQWRYPSKGYGYQAEFLIKELLKRKSFIQVQSFNIDRKWGKTKAFKLNNIISVSITFLKVILIKFRILK